VPVALVTGVTGQDGGYLAEKLVAEGWAVHGTVRPREAVPPHLTALGDAVQLHEADLLDPTALSPLLRRCAPSEVYNLAGISSVGQSWEQPVLTAQVNGVAVAALLEAVREQQERTSQPVRLLQASSAELFAGATTAPQDERTPVTPRSPYGASKAFAHHLCQLFRGLGVHAATVEVILRVTKDGGRRGDSWL
jgi:GDPmannose 4,6-dehydratase